MEKRDIAELIDKANPMVLDVGCYDGKDSLALARALGCEVHCFEPDPLSQDLFGVLHGKNPKLHLHKFALTDIDGEIDFYQSNHPQSNSTKEPKEHLNAFPGVKFDEVIKVQSMRLDSWHTGGVIDFIWADVNGSEKQFIEGGKVTLAKTRYLQLELAKKELYAGQSPYDPGNFHNWLIQILPQFRRVAHYNWGSSYGNILLVNIELCPQ